MPCFPNLSSVSRRITKASVLLGFWCLLHTPSFATDFQYLLFKNTENFGIVVFPKENLFAGLNQYIQSLSFKEVESGDAVMRFGSTNRDNQTYMMPESVQKKHHIEKFIILQVLSDQGILVGVYDPTWGLTLPFATYNLDEVKENIPKTLDIFRNKEQNKQDDKGDRNRTISWQFTEGSAKLVAFDRENRALSF